MIFVMSLPKTPALVSDCVVFDPEHRVLLVRRKNQPFAGCYALPGGFVDIGETIEAACRREVKEETGISIEQHELALVGVYSDPDRDPRGHIVSVAYTVTLDRMVEPHAGSDAETAEWISDWKRLSLGFNHLEILAEAEKVSREALFPVGRERPNEPYGASTLPRDRWIQAKCEAAAEKAATAKWHEQQISLRRMARDVLFVLIALAVGFALGAIVSDWFGFDLAAILSPGASPEGNFN
jgi:8-oxo-dGTP diphosphatase